MAKNKKGSKRGRLRVIPYALVFGVIGIVTLALSLAATPSGTTSLASKRGPITGKRTDWPCTGCITYIPATYDPNKPTVILAALHGDEGNPTYIESVWEPVASAKNAILFAPLCPTALGCRFSDGQGGFINSWWGWLQYSSQYDDSWIGNQMATISKSYVLDTSREFLTGWSGGADYLGWYAPTHSNQFAAANFVVGGVPYYQSCPARPQAAYFLMGSNDFRYQSGQPSQVKSVYDNCGYPTNMVVLSGATHQSTIDALTTQNYASTIFNWLMQHPMSTAQSSATTAPSLTSPKPSAARSDSRIKPESLPIQ